MYPTLDEYETSAPARWAVLLGAPRVGKWRGLVTLALGFTLQSLQVAFWAKQRKHLAPRHYLIAWLQTIFMFSTWVALGIWLGFASFVFVYVVPLMIANAIVMAHIVTNHSLSPTVDENDALATSLSVSVPKWFEFYTLGFGYHVEHHLFPAMSHRHGPTVQRHLLRVAPDRYQVMPFGRALAQVWNSPRVYRDATTLVDPGTSHIAHTLGTRPPVPLFEDGPPVAHARGSISELHKDGSRPQWKVLVDGVREVPRLSSVPPPSAP